MLASNETRARCSFDTGLAIYNCMVDVAVNVMKDLQKANYVNRRDNIRIQENAYLNKIFTSETKSLSIVKYH